MKVEILYDALYNRYKAKQQEALCNIQIYFMEGVGVADHPDTVKTVAKLFEQYADATEYLKLLRESRHEFIGQ
jgi:sensor histidine kinase regulating citrate/malate metabolism